MSGNDGMGWVVPPVLVLYGIVFPKIGRLFGRADRRFILEQVQNALGRHGSKNANRRVLRPYSIAVETSR
jgi:hypothetical protein